MIGLPKLPLIGSIISNMKYIPYKALEPKRLMSLVVGGVGMALGYGVDNPKWKMGMLIFGAVCISAYIAGVINPVTLYNRNSYASATEQQGQLAGQTDPWQIGRTAPGAYYGAGFQPASSHYDPTQPALGNAGGIFVPGVRDEQLGTDLGTGNITGQVDTGLGISGTTPTSYYEASYEPGRPPFYFGANNVVGCNPLTGEGCNEVPPTTGDIYIRDFGEVDFNGGI